MPLDVLQSFLDDPGSNLIATLRSLATERAQTADTGSHW